MVRSKAQDIINRLDDILEVFRQEYPYSEIPYDLVHKKLGVTHADARGIPKYAAEKYHAKHLRNDPDWTIQPSPGGPVSRKSINMADVKIV